MTEAKDSAGSVISVLRYPVKSMSGEEVGASPVSDRGLFGDRAYAVVDASDSKVATAKNPAKWPNLLDFRASLLEAPGPRDGVPPVRITLPDGSVARSDQPTVDQVLSKALHRKVKLHAAGAGHVRATAEEYWPDIEELEHQNTVTDFPLPEGTYFDSAPVHVLTSATLSRLREVYPEGRFDVLRFRPNIVVGTPADEKGFVEEAWVGHTLRIGATLRLNIIGPCSRCVMTTLPQGGLPRDLDILRTAARHNRANVGVYASVVTNGEIRRGDRVSVE